jgi:hypothetical protein
LSKRRKEDEPKTPIKKKGLLESTNMQIDYEETKATVVKAEKVRAVQTDIEEGEVRPSYPAREEDQMERDSS